MYCICTLLLDSVLSILVNIRMPVLRLADGSLLVSHLSRGNIVLAVNVL
jgi:hypothetical protein